MGYLKKTAKWTRQTAKVMTVTVLIFLLGGFLPFTLQCYAWIRMAQKAGGVEMLGEIVTQAPPCELCCAASDLQNKQTGKNDRNCPESRLEIHKSFYTLEISSFQLAENIRPRDLAGTVFSRWSARLPWFVTFPPETPPPEDTIA
ncbi:hypothetical protein [Luteolibacter sp. AS25]|uniref:hypothetical protein n=1 Tax=Luteolibacter sp. AS25 TaxID=3135776 RepID=UPI00398AD0CC